MATSNINKIVTGKLKPFVLGKNTAHIINSCISKIYKQPNTPAELPPALQARANKPENKGPIRNLKTNGGFKLHAAAALPRIPQVYTNTEEILLTKILKSSKKNSVSNVTPFSALTPSVAKKFLKSPNLKMYSSRRYGSSASNSNPSMFGRIRYEDRQRQRHQLLAKPDVSILPARSQHMAARVETRMSSNRTAGVTTALQYDLMMIDTALKDRISLRRKNFTKVPTIPVTVPEKKKIDPMDGWNHPQKPEIFLSRANERNIANAELMEQHRRLKFANKQPKFEPFEQKVDTSNFSVKRMNRVRVTDTLSSKERPKEISPRSQSASPNIIAARSGNNTGNTLMSTIGNNTGNTLMSNMGNKVMNKASNINSGVNADNANVSGLRSHFNNASSVCKINNIGVRAKNNIDVTRPKTNEMLRNKNTDAGNARIKNIDGAARNKAGESGARGPKIIEDVKANEATTDVKRKVPTEPTATSVLAANACKYPPSSYNASRYNRTNYFSSLKNLKKY